MSINVYFPFCNDEVHVGVRMNCQTISKKKMSNNFVRTKTRKEKEHNEIETFYHFEAGI